MLVQLHRTVKEWNSRSHLLPFLQKAPIVICIKSEDELAYIRINNGRVTIQSDSVVGRIHAELKGEKETLQSLLRGELKLRQLMATNLVSLHASFRLTLYLETLFFLAKPYRAVNDIWKFSEPSKI